jgi:hypothetical protein
MNALPPSVLIYATHHALAKGSLFLRVGPAHAAQTGLQRVVVGAGLMLPALALAGAPFTSGALAKTALKANLSFLPGGWAAAPSLLLPLAAVGTTLKMARFLWLTLPALAHPEGASAKGMWLPWLSLVGAMLAGGWLLPGALEVVPAAFRPEKHWDALWPLLAGGALAALGARLRRWFSGDLTRWLPAGDLGVFLEKRLSRIQLLAYAVPGPGREHRPEHDEPVAEGTSPWIRRCETVGWLLAQTGRRASVPGRCPELCFSCCSHSW